MPKNLSEVTRDAMKLPAAERLKLARIMLDMSEADIEPTDEVQSAWDKEIEQRLQELRSGQAKGVPLKEVQRKIKARFRS